MRILMLIPQYAPTIGGAERQAQGVAEGLVERGHSVAVLTQRVPSQPAEEMINGARVLRWLRGIPLGPLWGLTYLASVRQALRRLEGGADVVHCHQLYLHSTMAARRRGEGPPVVCKILLAGAEGDLARLARAKGGSMLLRWARRLDRVIAMAGAIERECREYGFRADQIARIPNFVDDRRFQPDPAQAVGDEWLFAGRLQPQKGLDILLEAMALAGGPAAGIRLAVAGQGPEEQALREQARRLGLKDRVRFLGLVPDPTPLIRGARGVVLPSRSEGLSNVMLEALACGKPLIATEVGAAREVMAGDDAADMPWETAGYAWTELGVLAKPESPQALAAALEAVESNPDVARRLARRAPSVIQKRFSRAAVLDKVERLYEDLTSPKP